MVAKLPLDKLVVDFARRSGACANAGSNMARPNARRNDAFLMRSL